MMNNISYDLAGQIVSIVTEKFLAGEYQEVYVLYNSFRSAVTQVLTLRKLLPIAPDEEGWKRQTRLPVRAIRGGVASRASTYDMFKSKSSRGSWILSPVSTEHG